VVPMESSALAGGIVQAMQLFRGDDGPAGSGPTETPPRPSPPPPSPIVPPSMPPVGAMPPANPWGMGTTG
jgi:hypothetical protein